MRRMIAAALGLSLLFAAPSAGAQVPVLQFTYVDPLEGFDGSWDQEQYPVPISYLEGGGNGFTEVAVWNVTGTVPFIGDSVEYYAQFVFQFSAGFGAVLGPQVYGGSEAAPVFSPESLSGFSELGGPGGTGLLTITAVNNDAVAGFGKTSGDGSLTNIGTDYVLDFGTVKKGSRELSSVLSVGNLGNGPESDLLFGGFSIASGSGDFGLSGFDLPNPPPLFVLAGGSQYGPLGVTFDPPSTGSFSETIDLNGTGMGFGVPYPPYPVDATLTIEGVVTGSSGAVPEPSTWAMMLIGLAGIGFAGRRVSQWRCACSVALRKALSMARTFFIS